METNLVPLANEVIIAFVQPVGTDLSHLIKTLSESCSRFNSIVERINLTDLIDDLTNKQSFLEGHNPCSNFKSSEYLGLSEKMFIGSKLREKFKNDIFAVYALSRIHSWRDTQKDNILKKNVVYILDSLKHPDEVKLLRETYKESFFLIGVDSPKEHRRDYLKKVRSMSDNEATELINRDEDEGVKHGQKMNKAFEQADFFSKSVCSNQEIDRLVNLIFGDSKISPTEAEYFMHLAASTAASSGDLSRQVGAVIVSDKKEILAVGRNEVPKFGGGQYWYDDVPNNSDKQYGYEANHKKREENKERLKLKDKDDFLDNITEYVRSVHAEMEAVLSCARKGQAVKDSVLYCTTFPCHNCAKHLVNAGVKSVIFIEAYPKSHALELHNDSLTLDEMNINPDSRMSLKRFYGVGPRRYLDLFSQTLSTGKFVSRKNDFEGSKAPWEVSTFDYGNTSLRFPMPIALATAIELNALKKLTNIGILIEARQNNFSKLLPAA